MIHTITSQAFAIIFFAEIISNIAFPFKPMRFPSGKVEYSEAYYHNDSVIDMCKRRRHLSHSLVADSAFN